MRFRFRHSRAISSAYKWKNYKRKRFWNLIYWYIFSSEFLGCCWLYAGNFPTKISPTFLFCQKRTAFTLWFKAHKIQQSNCVNATQCPRFLRSFYLRHFTPKFCHLIKVKVRLLSQTSIYFTPWWWRNKWGRGSWENLPKRVSRAAPWRVLIN